MRRWVHTAQRRAHRGESSSVGWFGAEPCRFTRPVLARLARLADGDYCQGSCGMGEGRHGRARRGKGREGNDDASASLSAKAAAWFLTRMAESHPHPIIPLHSTFCLPALQGHRDTRFLHLDGYHSSPTTVPPQSHHSPTTVPRPHTQPCTVARLHSLCLLSCYRNRNPEPRNRPSNCSNGMLVGGVRAPKQYNHHSRTSGGGGWMDGWMGGRLNSQPPETDPVILLPPSLPPSRGTGHSRSCGIRVPTITQISCIPSLRRSGMRSMTRSNSSAWHASGAFSVDGCQAPASSCLLRPSEVTCCPNTTRKASEP